MQGRSVCVKFLPPSASACVCAGDQGGGLCSRWRISSMTRSAFEKAPAQMSQRPQQLAEYHPRTNGGAPWCACWEVSSAQGSGELAEAVDQSDDFIPFERNRRVCLVEKNLSEASPPGATHGAKRRMARHAAAQTGLHCMASLARRQRAAEAHDPRVRPAGAQQPCLERCANRLGLQLRLHARYGTV